MAVAYDIKAIPTVYGARQFRSRLEAKWASFFDLCGWQFEYEPYDLGTWSPDFLLFGCDKVLVEIKPITSFDEDVAAKMVEAAAASKWDGELLLLGVAPSFGMDCGPYDSASIGWLGEASFVRDGTIRSEWDWTFGRASACLSGRPEAPDFSHQWGSYHCRMRGTNFKNATWPDSPDWLKRLWDKAANRVQWHKR